MRGPDLKTYLLIDPRDGEIRYVGCTRLSLEDRLGNHMAASMAGGPFETWKVSLKAIGLQPYIHLVAPFDCERRTMKDLTRAGLVIYNTHMMWTIRRELEAEAGMPRFTFRPGVHLYVQADEWHSGIRWHNRR